VIDLAAKTAVVKSVGDGPTVEAMIAAVSAVDVRFSASV
jgi:hypothetical protein